MPSHPIARKLIDLANLPLAAPSANISGRPSPTSAEHVLQDLKGRIPCIVDGGPSSVGVESTVIDISCDPPLILRPGGITLEQLREVFPNIQVYSSIKEFEEKPPTPGLKYKHYAPNAKLILFEEKDPISFKYPKKQKTSEQSTNSMKERITARVQEELKKGKKVAILHTHSDLYYDSLDDEDVLIYSLGSEENLKEIAQGLFAALRYLDNRNMDVILVEGIAEKDEGLAIMNRIRKAASEIM